MTACDVGVNGAGMDRNRCGTTVVSCEALLRRDDRACHDAGARRKIGT